MTVTAPAGLEEALATLAADPDALVLAGGTDLMVAVNAGRRRFESVIALRQVTELHEVELGEVSLRLGGGVTYTRLLADDIVAAAPALAQAARTVGSPPIRNAGTIGGNLATASPAGDTLPVLVALGASVDLASTSGRRTVPVEDFLTGVKRTALEPGELIVTVNVPVTRGGQEYRKVGVRNAMVIAVASVALVADAAARTVRVGLGSVGPVPLRAPEAEAWIAERLDWDEDRPSLRAADDAATFATMVAAAAQPIDDHRSTAAYRRHAVGVLAERCLRAIAR
ncbi:MAG: FAD binding domain-containing protein [Acidimicrobiales bacterium]